MRRILSDLLKYLGRLAAATRRGWNAFFFTPADPTPLGVIRVAVGLLTFWSLIVLGLDLQDYFGSERLGRPRRDLADPAPAAALCLVVLVPGP